jgi:hypothetical protein
VPIKNFAQLHTLLGRRKGRGCTGRGPKMVATVPEAILLLLFDINRQTPASVGALKARYGTSSTLATVITCNKPNEHFPCLHRPSGLNANQSGSLI